MAEIIMKFGGLAPNDVLNDIGGFEFGASARYHHLYMHTIEILMDFDLYCQLNHQI